jgi:molybdopterin-binding protein
MICLHRRGEVGGDGDLRLVGRRRLKVGKDVVALIKASSVLVMTEDAGLTLSARNCLTGKVKSLNIGPVHAEVTIAMDGGAEVHASITHQAATELGLKEGAGNGGVQGVVRHLGYPLLIPFGAPKYSANGRDVQVRFSR